MSKKSFFLRNVATTVACLAVFTLFWGCAKDKDKAPESTRTVTGQIVNLDNRKIMEIGFGFDNETGLTVPCTNGNFTIDLPETIDNSLLVDFREARCR